MKWLNSAFDFYLDASVHVAVAVLALMGVTGLLFDFSVDRHLLYFVFFGTIACYNFIKYGVEAEKYILVSSGYHRYIQFFSFIAIGISAYHANFLPLEAWYVLFFLALLIALYAIPVLPQARNLRSLGYLKVLMVAFVWGGTTVILPLVMEFGELAFSAHVEALQRFLLVLVLMLPFEVRDLAYDHPSLRTIPQRFGIGGARKLGYILSLAFFGLTALKAEPSATEWISKGVLALLLIVVLGVTRKEQSKYFASFWVEAIPVFWLILLAGLSLILGA